MGVSNAGEAGHDLHATNRLEADYIGWGEPGFNGGGVTRGAPTPNMNALAAQGLRLTNFNVEAQCTPSRAAIMTGRYGIRSGNATIPLGGGTYGLTQWEVTMAEMLGDVGYHSAMFGKWHLGWSEGRYPTDQGFDEFYGVETTDVSAWTSLPGFAESGLEKPVVKQSKKGKKAKVVRTYDLDETSNVLFPNTWVPQKATPFLVEHAISLRKFPPIKPGTLIRRRSNVPLLRGFDEDMAVQPLPGAARYEDVCLPDHSGITLRMKSACRSNGSVLVAIC